MIFLILIILSLFSAQVCAMETTEPAHNPIGKIKAIQNINSTINSISASQTEGECSAIDTEIDVQEQEMEEFCAIENKTQEKNAEINKIFEKITDDRLFNKLTLDEIFDIIKKLVENQTNKFGNEIDFNDQTIEYINKIHKKFRDKLKNERLSISEENKSLSALTLLEIKQLKNEINVMHNNLKKESKLEEIKKQFKNIEIQINSIPNKQQFQKTTIINAGLLVIFCLIIFLNKSII